MENKAWFWLMGNNWPLQKAQPLGGKFQLMIFTSPRNGSDMFFSLLPQNRRVYVCDGNIPNNERMKLTTRNGIMLSWGCDPPAGPIAAGSMTRPGATSL